MNQELKDRFFNKVTKTYTCWIWQGRTMRGGYGKFRIKRKEYSAHRISWEIHNDKIPKNMMVCHTCDNPPCVNPDHLFLGTCQDNMDDMKSKGRSPRGEQRPNSLLKDHDVRWIRKCYTSTNTSYEAIAMKYGVSETTIRHILNGHKWNHVI